jgi:aminoglycoside phosphotransferase (APT) family kinase protein
VAVLGRGDDAALRRTTAGDDELALAIAPRLEARFGTGARIATMRRTPLACAGTFPAEVLELELTTGDSLKLFVKDLSVSRLPKEQLHERRVRELRVYREILTWIDAGTPAYYGAVHDGPLDRLCLVLEFVDGVELRSLGFDAWIEAAAWLGRLHGAVAGHRAELERCAFLVRHDADYFLTKASLAQEAVAQVSAPVATRLAHVVRGYGAAVAVMADQPRTLVHGSYRRQNILVDRRTQPTRVCPVDWELAALGAPLYDFAFLSDGCGPPKLDALWNAYRREAERHGVAVPPREELESLLIGFRLHKVLKSLSECVAWSFPEQVVMKLVTLAESVVAARAP